MILLKKTRNLLSYSPLKSKACDKDACFRRSVWEILAGSWRERPGRVRDGDQTAMGVMLRSLLWAVRAQFQWDLLRLSGDSLKPKAIC